MEFEKKFAEILGKTKINKKGKILVAISGGKDSTVTAYLLKKLGYNIEGIFVDLCVDEYSKKSLESIKKFCNKFEIKLHVYDLKKNQGKGMKYFWKKNNKLNHCAVCGVFKKWVLNREARNLKADYIATGHNLDDETETVLLNICKGSLGLGIKSGILTKNISDKKFIPRLKPLFYFENREIKKFAEKNNLNFIRGICPYRQGSYRVEIREFIETLTKKEKEKIIKNFEKLSDKIKKIKSSEMNYCEKCGEPSRNKLCKMCELFKK
jgi:uncharacterized protein (TIGR00269 family)